jgi:hypothetical protein
LVGVYNFRYIVLYLYILDYSIRIMNGMGRDGTGWDGMGRDGTGRDGTGRNS